MPHYIANVAIRIAKVESEKIDKVESPRPTAAFKACAMAWSSQEVLDVVSVVVHA